MRPSQQTLPRLTSMTVLISLLLAACASQGAGPTTTTTTTTAAATTAMAPSPGLVVVPPGGAQLHETMGGETSIRAHEGLVLPVMEGSAGWFQVLTTCGREAWMEETTVEALSPAAPSVPGPGFDLAQAVLVVDPGHGGRDLGAVGPGRTTESEVNLEIAQLLRMRLGTPSSIDWDTGRVGPGNDYPAVQAVWLTRAPEGPLEGDVELGLGYRAQFANGTGADALVSIHNNSGPSTTSTSPGTDVFYAVSSPGSDRLASLIHEEMVRGLEPLSSQWGSADVSGPKSRVSVDTGDDFYGLLRTSDPPSVIVEGMYISNAREEAILGTSVGKLAYADGVYRGLIRFLTTDDWGSEVIEPEPFDADVGTVTNIACEVPEQP